MPPKKKAANGYKFAEPLPKGLILEAIGKQKWRLGLSIGKGGFGEIYSAQEESSKTDKYPYVIKIEPHENGPLFVEINFYIRNAKSSLIDEFKKEKGLKTFGMPVFHGSGSVEYKGQKYRFLVMEKFSTDLYKLFIDNKKVFPTDTVFKLGLQILDVLEYIHQRGYVHADIKASNLLLGTTKETQNKQVYLVDFGLATKYTMDKEFKPNPKKAHDGTIEYLSRDAHKGVQTRRGDLEILAYNLIQWLGCTLPWENNLSDPKSVQTSKEENMVTVSKMIKATFHSKSPPKAIVSYLTHLKTMEFNTEPDYDKIRTIFISGVKEGGGFLDKPLKFSASKTPLRKTRTPLGNSASQKVKANRNEENDEVNEDVNGTPKLKKRGRAKKIVAGESDDEMDVDAVSLGKKIKMNKNEENGEISKSKKGGKAKKGLTVDTAQSDVEMAEDDNINYEPNINFVTRRKPPNRKKELDRRISQSLDNLDNLNGYTDAMKEIINKKIKKDELKKRVNRTQQTQLSTSKSEENMTGFTDEMKAIARKKKLKENNSKKLAAYVPVATTSKASSKKGLVKPNSRRLQQKPTVCYSETARYSDESLSD